MPSAVYRIHPMPVTSYLRQTLSCAGHHLVCCLADFSVVAAVCWEGAEGEPGAMWAVSHVP